MRVDSALETIEGYRRTPTPAEEMLGVWPVVAGVTQAKPTYRNIRRVIPYHSLHLILSGTLRWESEHTGTPLTLSAGDLFCLFPSVAHSYQAAAADPQRMMYLAIDGPAAGTTVAQLGLSADQPILRDLPVKRFLGHLRLLHSTFAPDPDARAMLPTEYLARFLGEILTAIAGPRLLGTASLLERGRTFIDTHCTEDITVEDVAHHVGLTRSHFSTAFARQFEVTPRQYLWSRRLDRGRDLLRSTDLGVTEVALSVGFSDIYAFSHAYRRRFRTSPSVDRHRQPSPREGTGC